MKKLLALLSLVLIGQLLAAQRSLLKQKLDFNATDISVKAALFQLSHQTQVAFSAPSHLLPNKMVHISFKSQPLEKILNKLLEGSELSYKISDQQLIFYKKKKTIPLFTISGYIREKESGEPLPLATILEKNSGKGINSNEFGFYSITLPEGDLNLQFSYTGHQTFSKKYYLDNPLVLNVKLDASITLQEVLVTPEKEENFHQINTSSTIISAQEIRQAPTLGGEADVLRVISGLSGVNTGPDGFGGIYIRGSSMDQNLFLLDGVPVYNPLHTGGLYSIFDDHIIQNAQLYKGTAPARYGGRLSSVLDVKMKEGNHYKPSGSITLGIPVVKGSLEGPIQRGKSSFILSLRQSLFNTYLRPISRQLKERKGDEGHSKHSFIDFYSKINISIGKKDQLYLSFYAGGDKFEDDNESRITNVQLQHNQHNQKLDWGNRIIALRWNHLFNDKFFANTTLTMSRFRFRSEELYQEEIIATPDAPNVREGALFYQLYNSSIQDKAIKVDFSYLPSHKHSFRFGTEVINHTFKPGALALNDATSIIIDGLQHSDSIASISNTTHSQEYSVYFEDKVSIWDWLEFNIGFRTVLLAVEDTHYWSLQPRISAEIPLLNRLKLFADIGKTNQNVHMLTTSGFGLPSDLWVSATAKVPPQNAWQASIGLIKAFDNDLTLELSTYRKHLSQLIAYEEGASFLTQSITLNATDWESRVGFGKGKSQGIELSIKKEHGPIKGAINYTWSKATRQFDDINLGESFNFRFDRPHSLNIAMRYSISSRSFFSFSWVFQTGLPTTLPTSDYIFYSSNFFSPSTVLNTGQRNNFRLPNYHKLDIEYTIYLGKQDRYSQTLKIGVYNVYNRKNPIYYRLRNKKDAPEEREFVQVSLLPILPSLSYSYVF